MFVSRPSALIVSFVAVLVVAESARAQAPAVYGQATPIDARSAPVDDPPSNADNAAAARPVSSALRSAQRPAPTEDTQRADLPENCVVPPKKHEPMDGWAVGLSVGVSSVGAGRVQNPAYSAALVDSSRGLAESVLKDAGLREGDCTPLDKSCRTQGRSGFHLSVPLQLGGSGVGFRFEPFLTVGVDAAAYGMYLGPTFEFRVAKPLYLGFGFGLKADWVTPKEWRYAFDLLGRIPAHVTLYANSNIAIVFEAAFGAGASAFVSQPRTIKNPLTGRVLSKSVNLYTFGFGRTWDLSIGLRFP